MLEMKITVAAPDLAAALNNLAAALNGKNQHTVCNQYGTDNKNINNAGTVNVDANDKTQPVMPMAPVNPTPAPATQPTVAPAITQPTANPTLAPTVSPQAPGAPFSATPAQTAAPVAPTVPAVQPVPTGAPSYTLEMIATAGTALIDAGKMDQLLNLLGKYGVEALTALDPAQYGSFANDLRAIGAQI